MKATEELKNFRSLDLKKLQAELKESKKKLMQNSLKVQAGKLDNFSLVSKARKNIARIHSIISEKKAE